MLMYPDIRKKVKEDVNNSNDETLISELCNECMKHCESCVCVCVCVCVCCVCVCVPHNQNTTSVMRFSPVVSKSLSSSL